MSVPEGYILQEGYPTPEDYVQLRAESGLTQKTLQQAAAAIRGSWCGYYVAESATPSKAVAMGRVVGDGSWYFLVADMAVLPAHQRKGLGGVILKNLLEQIKQNAVEGEAYISLGADPPGRGLYAKHGFKDTMPEVAGMAMEVDIAPKSLPKNV
ncbi:putative GNAT family acetyltransferase [Clavulina sp. PMI_390]|nr:putative GNAT family acetyltransferase [Clavulina sp. PMI_390]